MNKATTLNQVFWGLLLLTGSSTVLAQDGRQLAEQQCASCHALEAPDYAALGLLERLDRKAPPLHYAGNKYRAEWLQQWLQDPKVLHPAGYGPRYKVVRTEVGEVPDVAALQAHPSLPPAEAEVVAEFLMGLRAKQDLIDGVDYSPGNVALRMGSMDFRKFKGCDSCHQDEEGSGGFSGPVLYNAWQRLQPEYLVSFTQDPRAWDPHTLMPTLEMNANAVHKLVDYLKLRGGEE